METKETFLSDLSEINLEDIVKQEYRTYQIYTLMDRAIPYLDDGLKPGQRRILYTLWKNQSKGLLKVSAATGLVLTLHPHGPASIETAIVNMAQDYTFANNYPLIDKKGYFGERMETSPAAGRYIECKLAKIATFLLFDDANQVELVPNYDESTVEPKYLLPKLPLMLLNGSEGIGTGFSSVIPSFHHKDICDSMIEFVKTGKPKKIKPFFHNYDQKVEIINQKLLFHMKFEKKDGKFFITETPRGYDATKLYKYLNKYIESGFIKDYIDSSVNNTVLVEIIFKKGTNPTLREIENTMKVSSSLNPNYTLISERGVKIFNKPEEIISIFSTNRLKIVQRRYELLSEDLANKINLNNEIVKFIRKKEYEVATKSKNRKTFTEYLSKKKYKFNDYLADMPIYRMTKEEVAKRQLLIKEDSKLLKEYLKISKSKTLIKGKLIKELEEVKITLNNWLKEKAKYEIQLNKLINKNPAKVSGKKKGKR